MSKPTDYDRIAARFAAGIDERPWNSLYERPATLALLPDVRGRDVLDVGCGHGWYSEALAARGARVVGIDLSAAMIALAERRAGDKARFFQADTADLQDRFPDGSFDLVLAALMLHYVADVAPVFREWARVLRPGGRVVLSVRHPIVDIQCLNQPGYLKQHLIEERWRWLGSTVAFYRRPLSALTEPMAEAGFVIERLCEPLPTPAMRAADPEEYERLCRLPGFLFIRARKDEATALPASALPA